MGEMGDNGQPHLPLLVLCISSVIPPEASESLLLKLKGRNGISFQAPGNGVADIRWDCFHLA